MGQSTKKQRAVVTRRTRKELDMAIDDLICRGYTLLKDSLESQGTLVFKSDEPLQSTRFVAKESYGATQRYVAVLERVVD